jgi:hypothetical protein
MGKIKEGRGPLIGNAGEYLVVGELLKRYIIAALAPRNNPSFDVLATNGTNSLYIRVKTKTIAAKSWVWMCSKRDAGETIFKNIRDRFDFSVLVDLKGEGASPEYYVIPTIELDKELKAINQRWLNSPPKRGKPHNPDDPMRRIGDTADQQKWLSRWKNEWSLILRELER